MAQGGQTNAYQGAANALTGAGATTQAELGFQPMMVTGQGYNAATMAGAGPITAQNVSGQGYNAATMAGVGPITAQNVGAGQIGSTNLGAYMNPFTQNVINTSMSDLARQRDITQQQNRASAAAAGAFGGSRHGLVEAETNRGFADAAARTAAGLQQQGFLNAQQMAGQDIATNLQAQLANQSAGLTAAQQNAANQLMAQQSNQAALNAAGQFGAQQGLQAQLANQSAGLTAAQQNAANQLTAQQSNQAALNSAGQFNAGQNLQAQLANQNAAFAGSQQRLGAANQLAGLGTTGFNMANTLQNQQWQQGLLQQQMQQQLLNDAQNQFYGFANSPQNYLSLLNSALAASPLSGASSSTTQNNPGLLGLISGIAGIGSLF